MIEFMRYALWWYLSGLAAMILGLVWDNYVKKDEIILKITDIFNIIQISLLGPLIWLYPFFHLMVYISRNYDKIKDVTLWKNHRAKVKETLFGEADNDNT